MQKKNLCWYILKISNSNENQLVTKAINELHIKNNFNIKANRNTF